MPTDDGCSTGTSQPPVGAYRQNHGYRNDDETLPDLDGSLFEDYSFSWAPNACFINQPAPDNGKQRLSKHYVSVLQKSTDSCQISDSLGNVRSILKDPSQTRSGTERLEPGDALGFEIDILLHSTPAHNESSQQRNLQQRNNGRASLAHKPSLASVLSKRLSISSLRSNKTLSNEKRKRNVLKKRSRQSVFSAHAVSHEAPSLPPGIIQSGRGIGYTFTPQSSHSRLPLRKAASRKCLSMLNSLVGAKNASAENLPRNRDDVMQHIYGSNWSVAHTTEAMLSTINFGIPEGLGRRVDSIDGGSNFAMMVTEIPKRSTEARSSVGCR